MRQQIIPRLIIDEMLDFMCVRHESIVIVEANDGDILQRERVVAETETEKRQNKKKEQKNN